MVSFKIEGRLKSAHYVAATTQTYRAAIDAAAPFTLTPHGRLDLEQSFSRGLTHGFLDGVNHQELVQGRFPKSRGVRVGTVVRTTQPRRAGGVGRTRTWSGPATASSSIWGNRRQDEPGGRVYEVNPHAQPRPGGLSGVCALPGSRS